MLNQLKRHHRLEITLYLVCSSLFCFALSLCRWEYTGTKQFLFLNWNLFLAFVPWACTSLLTLRPVWQQNALISWGIVGVWLLFFPNAPYILTDLFHLKHRNNAPIWFDLVLIVSFAWVGLLYGISSLFDIERILRNHVRTAFIPIIIIKLLFISGFGIYLGRYLRWNSWDILHNPQGLLNDIALRFFNPAEHPRAWGVTLAMGLLLNLIYWSVKFLFHHRHHSTLAEHVEKRFAAAPTTSHPATSRPAVLLENESFVEN